MYLFANKSGSNLLITFILARRQQTVFSLSFPLLSDHQEHNQTNNNQCSNNNNHNEVPSYPASIIRSIHLNRDRPFNFSIIIWSKDFDVVEIFLDFFVFVREVDLFGEVVEFGAGDTFAVDWFDEF